jgi:hypothetical protein
MKIKELRDNVFWLCVLIINLYCVFMTLTDQIIAGKL